MNHDSSRQYVLARVDEPGEGILVPCELGWIWSQGFFMASQSTRG